MSDYHDIPPRRFPKFNPDCRRYVQAFGGNSFAVFEELCKIPRYTLSAHELSPEIKEQLAGKPPLKANQRPHRFSPQGNDVYHDVQEQFSLSVLPDNFTLPEQFSNHLHSVNVYYTPPGPFTLQDSLTRAWYGEGIMNGRLPDQAWLPVLREVTETFCEIFSVPFEQLKEWVLYEYEGLRRMNRAIRDKPSQRPIKLLLCLIRARIQGQYGVKHNNTTILWLVRKIVANNGDARPSIDLGTTGRDHLESALDAIRKAQCLDWDEDRWMDALERVPPFCSVQRRVDREMLTRELFAFMNILADRDGTPAWHNPLYLMLMVLRATDPYGSTEKALNVFLSTGMVPTIYEPWTRAQEKKVIKFMEGSRDRSWKALAILGGQIERPVASIRDRMYKLRLAGAVP
ncbi:hypothetical protein B0H11DRAFT_2031378 [Mycena galericulata]|nr:hypothetical protein B0H11DRAFT_2031378 [Mycena galericulata]